MCIRDSFQIVDDVLDVTASETELGKPAGQDIVEGIYTLPVIYGIASSPDLRELLGRPLDAAQRDRVRELATANGAVDAALDVARDHAAKADEALAGAADLDAGVADGLRRLVAGLVTRDR